MSRMSKMSGTSHMDGPVTRSGKRRAEAQERELEERMIPWQGAEMTIGMPPPSHKTGRVWYPRHKSERRGNLHPSMPPGGPGRSIGEGDVVFKLSKDDQGGNQVVGKYTCLGDSGFYAKRFNGEYQRMLQLVRTDGGGGYESHYYSEDDPRIIVYSESELSVSRKDASKTAKRM